MLSLAYILARMGLLPLLPPLFRFCQNTGQVYDEVEGALCIRGKPAGLQYCGTAILWYRRVAILGIFDSWNE
jgi:hypothetical protein